jgi:hypothetical protein
VFIWMIKTYVDTLLVCMVKIGNHKEDRELEGKVNDISQTSVVTTVQSLWEIIYTNTAQSTLSSCTGHTLAHTVTYTFCISVILKMETEYVTSAIHCPTSLLQHTPFFNLYQPNT